MMVISCHICGQDFDIPNSAEPMGKFYCSNDCFLRGLDELEADDEELYPREDNQYENY